MTSPKKANSTADFERTLNRGPKQEKYVLRLYITGMTPRSTMAVEKVKTICEEHLHDRYALEIVDVYQQPALAREEQLIAIPTLIKKLPLPLRRFIGDMSQTERILVGLELNPKSPTPDVDASDS